MICVLFQNHNFAISKCFNEILESGMNSSNQASFLTNCLQGLDSELKLKTSFTPLFFQIPEMIQQRTLTKAEYSYSLRAVTCRVQRLL